MLIRQATVADFPAIHRVRMSVRENRLADPTRIGLEDYRAYIEERGRGWVAEIDGELAAFAIADLTDASIWALFVDPRYEGRGAGRALHDEMVGWLFASGLPLLQLGTDPGTRAERFYRRAGWACVGQDDKGELRFELREQAWAAAD